MSRGARILLVDDLPQNLEILSGLLEPEGYALDLAQDGQQAVEMALKNPPDLILMDVSMPRMTGLEACRALKSDERTRLVPIVLITALSAREDRIAGHRRRLRRLPGQARRLRGAARPHEEPAAPEGAGGRAGDGGERAREPGQRPRGQGRLHPRTIRNGSRTTPKSWGARWACRRATGATSGARGLLHDIGKIGIPLDVPPQAGAPHHRRVRRGQAPSRDQLRDLPPPAHHGSRCSPSSAGTTSGSTERAIPTASGATKCPSSCAASPSPTSTTPSPPIERTARRWIRRRRSRSCGRRPASACGTPASSTPSPGSCSRPPPSR